ncbi:MAG: hypothetical protein NC184_05365 [Roseburia sp.]|nr:hypothetical protein [Roseburia sp.]
MFKSKKFKQAEREFAEQTKSFDRFCAENNIEVKQQKISKVKRNVWIGAGATLATAAVVVCCCIPLMRQSTVEEWYYSEGDVSAQNITVEGILNDDSRDIYLFNLEYLDDYMRAQRVYKKDDDSALLGYNILDAVWYNSYQDDEYVFEFDCHVRIDRHYRFKDLALYNDTIFEYDYKGISYKYKVYENDNTNDVYLMYEYSGVDYYIHMYESEYTTELNRNSVEVFIKTAFEES